MEKKLREITEKIEKEYLSAYAQLTINSKGRQITEDPCMVRTNYQRDRDRIIHSESFRKLKGKTQVFIVKYDFFRTRLTHTLELSQISRTIARALRLNEDLTEAIALGHDLGHTCFGHSGEEELNKITGHFKHNEQSLRVVDILEREGKGLNLTFEVRDGILNHTGSGIPVTLEGKLVKLADRVTYLCHDIQDSISAGILKERDIPERIIKILGNTHSARINTFVKDIIDETLNKLEKENIDIHQTEALSEAMLELREFMFKRVYNGDVCMKERGKAVSIVRFLYDYFMGQPEEMPYYHKKRLNEEPLDRIVSDYIAGCTDNYAINLFKSKFIPSPK